MVDFGKNIIWNIKLSCSVNTDVTGQWVKQQFQLLSRSMSQGLTLDQAFFRDTQLYPWDAPSSSSSTRALILWAGGETGSEAVSSDNFYLCLGAREQEEINQTEDIVDWRYINWVTQYVSTCCWTLSLCFYILRFPDKCLWSMLPEITWHCKK